MKALTLHQPWATLWAAGIKGHETRSWWTLHRGLLAVHAGKAKTEDGMSLWEDLFGEKPTVFPSDGVLDRPGLRSVHTNVESFDALPFGAIVGVVYIDACLWTSSTSVPGYTRLERRLGNFDPDRYAWRASWHYALVNPIPCRGYQGLWDVPPDIAEHVEAQLPEVTP